MLIMFITDKANQYKCVMLMFWWGPVGAALAANTGAAGAMHRVGFFAAKAAPTGWTAPKKLDTNPTLGGSMGKYTEQFKLTAITAYL
ncbi:hypothetical protein, partial [Pseudomonas sp. B5(2017)]|uniref:hypothetical protein n=1 Tax=Pseudomonas sp. B5(2017) TaxID=1981714 RepID=UPI001C48F237